jgi:hypothetical protein
MDISRHYKAHLEAFDLEQGAVEVEGEAEHDKQEGAHDGPAEGGGVCIATTTHHSRTAKPHSRTAKPHSRTAKPHSDAERRRAAAQQHHL